MGENIEIEIKSIRQDDDIYICRSDLILAMAKVKNVSEGAEAKQNIQVLMDMIANA